VPELVASVVLPDTVVAVLPAEERDGLLVLRGVLVGDSVTGTWSYGGRAAGGWGGRFVLRRRTPSARGGPVSQRQAQYTTDVARVTPNG
jgi:hypothetical protein